MEVLRKKAEESNSENWCSNTVTTMEAALATYGDAALVQGRVKEALEAQGSKHAEKYVLRRPTELAQVNPPPGWDGRKSGKSAPAQSGQPSSAPAQSGQPSPAKKVHFAEGKDPASLEAGPAGREAASPGKQSSAPEKEPQSSQVGSQGGAGSVAPEESEEGGTLVGEDDFFEGDIHPLQDLDDAEESNEEGDAATGSKAHEEASSHGTESPSGQQLQSLLSPRVVLKEPGEKEEQDAQELYSRMASFVSRGEEAVANICSYAQALRTESNKSIAEIRRHAKTSKENEAAFAENQKAFGIVLRDLQAATKKIVRFADDLGKKGGSGSGLGDEAAKEVASEVKQTVEQMKQVQGDLAKSAETVAEVEQVNKFWSRVTRYMELKRPAVNAKNNAYDFCRKESNLA